MAARTASKATNWDGRFDKRRQNSKWRRSSSDLARDPHHTLFEHQPLETRKPTSKLGDQRRAEQSAFRSNLERDSRPNSTANARLHSHADTTSTFSRDMHHYHLTSVAHTTSNSVLPPTSLIASSKSSHLTPNSSVHASRVHNSRPSSSHKRIAPLRRASMIESNVIDLTLEDTEDELSVGDILFSNSTHHNHQYTDPGPSRLSLSSANSSPITLERSLFTPPPPPKRRIRQFIDHIAVPSFPKGLTKSDYQPLFDHSVVPPPSLAVTGTAGDSPLAAPSSATKEHTPPQKREGKEREHDMISSPERHQQHSSAEGADSDADLHADTLDEHAMIPLYDDDTYPPLTTLDLAINSRFQFAHSWRERASKLREAELEWISKYKLLGKACIWAQSGNNSLPRIPGTAGFVSCELLRPLELVPPESSPQEMSADYALDEQVRATGSDCVTGVDPDYMLLPHDAQPGPSAALDPGPSNSTVSPGLTVVDTEHDMNQYLNGFSDPPATHDPPGQQLTPTHTFRPHMLHSAKHAQMDSLGFGFPPSELDSRVTDTGDHECFLGVPPTPPPADTQLSTVSGSFTEAPFEAPNFIPPSPNNVFEASPAGAWSFKQGEGFLPDEGSPSNNHVAPSAPGTIDPSLLGLEKSEIQSRAPKVTTLKRRSKLPEPVIYIRRPADSSSLPLLSGKRPVQIKYRDSRGSPATPSTQTGSNETLSNPFRNSIEQTGVGADDPLPTKRRSAPSRKLREYHAASDSDSDYVPETSVSGLRPKQPSFRDKEPVVEHHGNETMAVPTASFCHQCRNKSTRPKMSCSNLVQGRVCGKRFCNRCILYRYPDITFDEHSAGFLCPVCTNTCNCSFCSRNRGEEFISMRLGGLATSLFKAKVMLVRDADNQLPRPHSPPAMGVRRSASTITMSTPEPSAQPAQSQFWAHVYGMEGQRVGSAFMTREHMDRLRAGGPAPPPSLSQAPPPKKARKPRKRDKERERPRGPRVFIGRPLASWKVRAVRDLEPSVDVETNGDKGKGKDEGQGRESTANDRRRRRCCYIGDRAALYEPYQGMPGVASPPPTHPASPSLPSSRCSTPVLGSEGRLTPLSGLGANDWPQPEVGECCTWEPLLPLGTIVNGPPVEPRGAPSAEGALPDLDRLQGLGSGSGSAVEMGVDVGDKEASASPTGLSDEELKKAIHAALAAVGSIEQPC